MIAAKRTVRYAWFSELPAPIPGISFYAPSSLGSALNRTAGMILEGLPGPTLADQWPSVLSGPAGIILEGSFSKQWFGLLEKFVGSPGYIAVAQDDSLAVQVEEVLEARQRQRIVIPNVAEVRSYLLRYPDLLDVLADVSEAACHRFGCDTQLSLEVHRDPESSYEYLTLCARQQNYDQRMMNVISELSAQFGSELARKSGRFFVTTDLGTPR